MPRITFDLDVLRTLVVGVELGSFAKAADRLGRSTSAVSAQLKKLEGQAGSPVLRKVGRRMVLTPTGEVLLSYAQRLLQLNDEAASALRGADLQGQVRLGVQEDFGESLLPAVLGSFARAHPKVVVQARLARNAELVDQVERGRLDLALAWNAGRTTARTRRVARLQMQWIGRDGLSSSAAEEPVPLALLEAPCLMRSTAIAALDKARRPWRIAFTSPSLAGIWAAVDAGLGITVRTSAGLPERLTLLQGLPRLPAVGLVLLRSEAAPSPPVQRLETLLQAHLGASLAPAEPPRRRGS